MKKVFISHSHKDSFFAEKMIDLLEKVNPLEGYIYCTSVKGYDISAGENFLEKIKTLLKDNVLVIFLLSENYYTSTVSQCEMGASWITAKEVLPVIIPPMTIDETEGVFKQNINVYINDKHGLNLIKEKIEELFEIKNKSRFSSWERFRDRMINSINNYIGSDKIIKNEFNIKKKDIVQPINKIKETGEAVLIINGLEFIKITNGNYNRIIDNKEILITQEFLISKYLITQSLYKEITGKNPSNYKSENHPIENVNFIDAVKFCNKFSKQNGFEEIYSFDENNKVVINELVMGFRLPFEYEWEYSLKYNDIDHIKSNLNNIAWFSRNSEGKTKEVGKKLPNKNTMYDMLGNVWEWCNDNFKNVKDLEKINSCKILDYKSGSRVLRGGSSVDFETEFTKKGFRKRGLQSVKNKYFGFRIVLQ